MHRSPQPPSATTAATAARFTALIAGALTAVALPLIAAPQAPPLPAPEQRLDPAEAQALERLRRSGAGSSAAERRRQYLTAAHALLQRFWSSERPPRLLLPGDRATGCGRPVVRHPMAFYCPQSREIGMALDLRRSVRTARGRTDRELLLLDLAVLAHEWGHHVNRERSRGPYGGGLGLTVKQEELAADWRTGVFLGWLLRHGVLGVDDYTQTANLLFEMGDYERIAHQHHGYPRERFTALTRGLAAELPVGMRLGEWRVDTPEAFSRALPGESNGGLRVYEVRRFEVERSNQIATNLVGGLLGAASCAWGSREQCLGMALQQGKGRAEGSYTQRRLRLDCSSGRFDVSEDPFEAQPLARDGKGQAAVLAARDCGGVLSSAGN
jgi:predicted metalloprotease